MHGGGTTNLWSHLQTWHKMEYDKLSPEADESSTSKQKTMESFVSYASKYSNSSERAKKLTSAICQFIVRDIR